jgi:signal peptidase
MKFFFKAIYYFLVASLTVVVFFLLFPLIPIKGNYSTYVVISGSMQPKIKIGSIVAVKPEQNYDVGDVVTFGESSRTKTPTTHRIYEIKEVNGAKQFITKGDANNAPDQGLKTQSEISGKVLFSVPYLGYAVTMIKKPIGFMFIIIVPAVIIIYDEINKIIREIKRIKKKKKTEEKVEESNIDENSFVYTNGLIAQRKDDTKTVRRKIL